MQNHIVLFILVLAATAIVSFAYAIWRGRKDEQILRSIIQSSPIPMFVISTNHRILHWNRALEASPASSRKMSSERTSSGGPFTNRRVPAWPI